MDNSMPVVSKIFCSSTLTTLMIRRRPTVVNGGGFVVTDLGNNVVFIVDGCGIL
ncbi:Os04g0446000, partial [Oryza sativa Japonica Group]